MARANPFAAGLAGRRLGCGEGPLSDAVLTAAERRASAAPFANSGSEARRDG